MYHHHLRISPALLKHCWRTTTVEIRRDFLKGWTKPALVMFSDKCFVSRGLDDFFMHLVRACLAL